MKGRHHVFMDEAAGAAGGGAAAGAAAAGGADASAGGAGGDVGGAKAAAAAGGGAGAGADAGAGAGGAAAAAGAAGGAAAGAEGKAGKSAIEAGATGAEGNQAFIPEKYQVKKEDGSLDLEASSRKVAEAYGALEKRVGQGGLPPKTAAEYKMPALPEGVAIDETTAAAFREDAHKAGMTQAQYEFVVGKWADLAPKLAEAGNKLAEADCIKELQTNVWKDPAEFKTNMGAAYRAATSLVQGEEEYAQLNQRLGNDPLFVKMMARVGAQMAEDKTPSAAAGGGAGGGETVEQLMALPAYSDPKHADHKSLSAKVNKMLGVGGPNDTPVN